MPHLKVSSYDYNAPLPSSNGEIMFHFLAKSSIDTLLFCTIKGLYVHVRIHEISGGYLIKCDKGQEITSYEKSHLLLYFIKVFKAECYFSNVRNKSIFHLEYKDMIFKSISSFDIDSINSKKRHVEIGFGTGRHLLYQCKKNPDDFYIGLEVYKPSLLQVAKQSKIQNILNLNIINYDGRLFLSLLKSNSIDTIYLYFPVPWDKSPNKRVINYNFINEVMRVLKVGGIFHLRTDSDNYFKYSIDLLKDMDINTYITKLNEDIEISSKYEDRWKLMDKNIHDLIITSNSNSKEVTTNYDFTFNEFSLDKLKNLVKKKYLSKDGFFIINDIYKSEKAILFPIQIGSFYGNESLFLIYEDETLKYFPKTPISTYINYYLNEELKVSIKDE